MRLYVYVLEAKDLPLKTSSYVKLQLGKFKSKTRTVRNGSDPVWNEEFVFRVHEVEDELILSIYDDDDDDSFRLFNVSGYLVGRVRIPVWSIAGEENHCLSPTWFSLQKPKTGKYSKTNSGRILLTLSLHGRGDDATTDQPLSALPSITTLVDKSPDHISLNGSPKSSSRKIPQGKKLIKAVANRLEKLIHKSGGETSKSDESSDLSVSPSEYEECTEVMSPSSCSFEDFMDMIQSRDGEQEMPENLRGGVLIDQIYVVMSKDLNALLFAQDSQFRKDLAEMQGVNDMQEGPWTWKGDPPCLTRVVTYTNPATRLVKAVKATEEQTYLKADSGEYAIFVSVDTPDVPYGSTFRVELLYKIMHGPELSSGEESSRLIISWELNFSQSTMMKGMIEGGARQGLKESFACFRSVLAQNFKTLNNIDSNGKDHVLAALQREHQSNWEFAIEYFGNLTVISAVFLTLYVIAHILLCEPHKPQGLEINGVELPDSFGQLITCGILVLLLERVYYTILHFVQARLQMGSDHGVKSQGDGWVVTVALVEACNLAKSLETTVFSDPFVVLTCNGKTRTSSVQLQTCDPQWNEILEFDASEELPSVLDVEVFDFDGPFDQAASLGNAEINFLKHSATELADLWVPLEGKHAVSSQAKVHLRIFVENKKGLETIKEYLTKMEKEVGKKLNLRSPHKNMTFQKLFGLPSEEFLIKDYSCSLRRKMHLQGRLFLSARIVGFYANLFGHKTKFFFLWEDIEDIEVQPPSLASMGSPTLVIVLRKGKGIDARHGAKSIDEEGRLRFYFQSFIPFDAASRTITALWRARAMTPEKKALISEEQLDQEQSQLVPHQDGATSFNVEDANMSNIYSADLPVNVEWLMKTFEGGELERKVMAKSGCLNYVTTQWEALKPDVYERQLSYRFNHNVSIFGAQVKSTQTKSPLKDEQGWIINEVMALLHIPFSDHFRVHLRYHFQSPTATGEGCSCDVYLGILWLKDCKFQQRITKNINEKFVNRLKRMFELAEREIMLENGHSCH